MIFRGRVLIFFLVASVFTCAEESLVASSESDISTEARNSTFEELNERLRQLEALAFSKKQQDDISTREEEASLLVRP
jgi:hypothetical protein